MTFSSSISRELHPEVRYEGSSCGRMLVRRENVRDQESCAGDQICSPPFSRIKGSSSERWECCVEAARR